MSYIESIYDRVLVDEGNVTVVVDEQKSGKTFVKFFIWDEGVAYERYSVPITLLADTTGPAVDYARDYELDVEDLEMALHLATGSSADEVIRRWLLSRILDEILDDNDPKQRLLKHAVNISPRSLLP